MPIAVSRLLSVALLITLASAAIGADNSNPTLPVLKLAAKGAVLDSNSELYGHNVDPTDWHGSDATHTAPIYIDPATGKPDRAWTPLTRAFPLHRLRLNMGNNYPWRDDVGPLAQRKTIKHESWNLPWCKEAGIDEYLRWAESLPKPTQPTLIASPLRPVQELADLVAYCNATTGPMAKLRAANGHPKPYNVIYWEMGNEIGYASREAVGVKGLTTDAEKNERMRPSDYVALLEPRISAMRAVDPRIRIYVVTVNPQRNAEDPKWAEWHRELLRTLRGKIDGLVVHFYYDGYSVIDELQCLDVVVRDVRKARAQGKPVSIWMSEQARWMNEKNPSDTWGLKGTISTADWLIALMERPEVTAANYWCYSQYGYWRVLQRDGDRRYGTGIFELYRVLDEITLPKTQPLAVNHDGFTDNPAPYNYTASAVLFAEPKTGRKALLMVNRSPEQDFEVRFPLGKGEPVAVRRIVLTGPSLSAASTQETPDAVTRTEWISVATPGPDGVLKLRLPARSVTAWVLSPVKS